MRALAALAVVLGACRGPAEPPAEPASGGSSHDAAELHLASRSFELVDVGASPPRLLADERGPSGTRAVQIAVERGAIEPLAGGRAGESRAVAAFPNDERALVEWIAPGEREARLLVRGADGRLLELPPPLPARERFLGWLRGGAAFATAGAREAGGPESLFEIDARGLLRRELDRAEPGFAIAAVDAEARRLALVRAVHDDADELVLRDRGTGESRLLLPTAADGRFRPQLFLPDGDLLVLADDGSDLPRLERLDPVSGRRRPFALIPCTPVSARLDPAAAIVVGVACDGRRELRRYELDGTEIALPATPAGTRLTSLLLAPSPAPSALAAAGPAWPGDLALLDRHGLARPLTYGLAARLSPARPALLEPTAVASGGIDLPCELRRESPRSAVGVVWMADESRPARFDEYDPLFAAIASRGAALLVCHGRGSGALGRWLRRGADGDRAGAARADARAALAALRSRLAPGAPLALVGEGAWWGAAALALGGAGELEVNLALALFPDPDPFAALDAVAVAPEPLRSRGVEIWGDPESPELAAQRAEWNFPVGTLRVPTRIALDAEDPASPELAARVAAASAAGAPVAILDGRRSRFSGAPLGGLARALVDALANPGGPASATTPERR